MLRAFYSLLSCIIFLAVLLDCVNLIWMSVGVPKNVIQSTLNVWNTSRRCVHLKDGLGSWLPSWILSIFAFFVLLALTSCDKEAGYICNLSDLRPLSMWVPVWLFSLGKVVKTVTWCVGIWGRRRHRPSGGFPFGAQVEDVLWEHRTCVLSGRHSPAGAK